MNKKPKRLVLDRTTKRKSKRKSKRRVTTKRRTKRCSKRCSKRRTKRCSKRRMKSHNKLRGGSAAAAAPQSPEVQQASQMLKSISGPSTDLTSPEASDVFDNFKIPSETYYDFMMDLFEEEDILPQVGRRDAEEAVNYLINEADPRWDKSSAAAATFLFLRMPSPEIWKDIMINLTKDRLFKTKMDDTVEKMKNYLDPKNSQEIESVIKAWQEEHHDEEKYITDDGHLNPEFKDDFIKSFFPSSAGASARRTFDLVFEKASDNAKAERARKEQASEDAVQELETTAAAEEAKAVAKKAKNRKKKDRQRKKKLTEVVEAAVVEAAEVPELPELPEPEPDPYQGDAAPTLALQDQTLTDAALALALQEQDLTGTADADFQMVKTASARDRESEQATLNRLITEYSGLDFPDTWDKLAPLMPNSYHEVRARLNENDQGAGYPNEKREILQMLKKIRCTYWGDPGNTEDWHSDRESMKRRKDGRWKKLDDIANSKYAGHHISGNLRKLKEGVANIYDKQDLKTDLQTTFDTTFQDVIFQGITQAFPWVPATSKEIINGLLPKNPLIDWTPIVENIKPHIVKKFTDSICKDCIQAIEIRRQMELETFIRDVGADGGRYSTEGLSIKGAYIELRDNIFHVFGVSEELIYGGRVVCTSKQFNHFFLRLFGKTLGEEDANSNIGHLKEIYTLKTAIKNIMTGAGDKNPIDWENDYGFLIEDAMPRTQSQIQHIDHKAIIIDVSPHTDPNYTEYYNCIFKMPPLPGKEGDIIFEFKIRWSLMKEVSKILFSTTGLPVNNLIDSRSAIDRVRNLPASADRAANIVNYFNALKDHLREVGAEEAASPSAKDFHDIIIEGIATAADQPEVTAESKVQYNDILTSFYVYKEIAKKVSKIII